MASKNDVTGDSLKSRPSSDQYRNNWDNIFKKKKKEEEKKNEKMGV